ncbi:helicase C-terminal domain-containing protein [Symbiobacterium thermophilum]|uniref:3'-5' exonuclease DinG n=1 Tax=Symbiobacterium thermophilum (strain DSM 24528 / JCM 14929 / IAM 14863 / T) TaxID=292459 RepID=Q67NP5_SYMTH|nr:helicase C-terminal domain-containing protein [Symbiobacterium thermophilum]BAD40698.1 ATP-dependent DNA helicase [Symbiobacterium thermophilum IAM 14863]
MGLRSFVAIDVETTGTSPEHDRLIEVAAVRFEDGREIGCFSRLIDPGCPVPQRIQHLTGIHPAMLAGKPRIEEVVPDLASFLGDLPLVAHNAPFDVAFLQAAFARAGRSLPNWSYDTAELARVALPLARNHRLATLAELLGLPLEHHHRAEDDARACGRLFLRLLERLASMDMGLLQFVLAVGEPAGWSLSPLFRAELEAREARGEKPRPITEWIRPHPGPLHRPDPEPEPVEPGPIDPALVLSVLGSGGAISEAIAHYEHRPQQLELAEAVTRSFNDGAHLLMEAGTGTGKSLAYLVPAFAWARANGEKVAISTHTITLQEQLWEKDIPFLQSALAGTPLEGVEAALVKGRSNYICLRKWEEAAVGADFLTSPEERRFLIRLAAWLAETETGDRSELNLSGEEERFWRTVQSETETCLGPKCKWFRSHCFAFRARRRARDAQVLVLNHALLFADIAAGNQVLPPFRHLIIDEAHHLEAVATQNLGVNLESWDITGALLLLYRAPGQGLLPQLRRRLGRGEAIPARPPVGLPSEDLIDKLVGLVQHCRAATDELFRLCADLVEARGRSEEEGGARALRLTDAVRTGPLWEALEQARANAVHRLRTLAAGLALLAEALELQDPPLADADALLVDIQKQNGILIQSTKAIDRVLLEPAEGEVTWIESAQRGDRLRVALRAAPINVGDILRADLFGRMRSVIMTSATLTVGESFAHLKERLGLSRLPPDRLREGVLSSPFAYREQALLLVPEDLPNPKEGDFTQAAVDFLRRFLIQAGGRTLVLFTSHRQLRQVYQALKDDLEAEGLLLLGQGLDGSRSRLVAEFRAGERTVLFGSASFWEGVDIPGEGLSAVVMVRLPFNPPDDPVMEARIEDLERRGLSSFAHLSLPQAVIRFKQGFGRLIRTRGDRGVVIVLDNRLSPRGSRYGLQFLRSLPGPAVFRGRTDEVINRAMAWLNLGDEA